MGTPVPAIKGSDDEGANGGDLLGVEDLSQKEDLVLNEAKNLGDEY